MCALASAVSKEASKISELPDIESDCDEAWRDLVPGVRDIYLRKSMSKSHYLKLYKYPFFACCVIQVYLYFSPSCLLYKYARMYVSRQKCKLYVLS